MDINDMISEQVINFLTVISTVVYKMNVYIHYTSKSEKRISEIRNCLSSFV